jgi:hypothetical protein
MDRMQLPAPKPSLDPTIANTQPAKLFPRYHPMLLLRQLGQQTLDRSRRTRRSSAPFAAHTPPFGALVDLNAHRYNIEGSIVTRPGARVAR